MFFRDKKSPTAKSPTLQLVENIRKDGKVRQRVIVSLGTHFALPKEHRAETARVIEDKLQGQSTLWVRSEINSYAERVIKRIQHEGKWTALTSKRKDNIDSDISDKTEEIFVEQVTHGQTREAGPLLVGLKAWDVLKLDTILLSLGLSENQVNNAKIAVLNRLIHPGSENAIPFWIKTTAVEELICAGAEEFKEDRFYRISDLLLDYKQQLEHSLYQHETKRFKLSGAIWLYDLTNTYFEGTAEANPKAQYNKNQKEKRTDCPQIVIALVLDEDGFIRRHFTYNGKLSDVKSLEKILKELEGEFTDVDKPTIVMDRGIASEDNIELLKQKGLHYIIASRREEEQANSKEFNTHGFSKMEISNKQSVELKVIENDQELMLLCKSQGRKDKETAIRNLKEQRLESDLEKLSQSIQQCNVVATDKINQSIGRIKERHPRVAKYYSITYTHTILKWDASVKTSKRLLNSLNSLKKNIIKGKTGHIKATKKINEFKTKYADEPVISSIELFPSKLNWSPNSERKEILQNTDGGYILKTSRTDLGQDTIWQTYVQLTKVEKAFRNFKSDLGLRPNFHLLEQRVDGHVFITVLAYHLLHTIEFILQQRGIHTSWWRLNQVLSSHCYTTIVLPTVKGDILHVRKAGEPEAIHKEIYDKLGIEYRNLPVTKIRA